MPDDERPEIEQLTDFFKLALLRVLTIPETHDVTLEDIELAIVVRMPPAEGGKMGPRFIYVRSFEGQDEFEEMLEQARFNVSMWDVDPTHVEVEAFDLAERSPFEPD